MDNGNTANYSYSDKGAQAASLKRVAASCDAVDGRLLLQPRLTAVPLRVAPRYFKIARPRSYILFNVKFPDPVHPEVTPVNVHVPVIVLLFTEPFRTSVLPGGVPDVMVNWKLPVILPLKFPLRTKDPVCDPPEVKHGVDVVKLRFVPVTVLPLL